MSERIKYNGTIKLFGLFSIRKNLDLTIEVGHTNPDVKPNPYLFNSEKITVLEPFLQKICTISWVRV